MRFLLLVCWDAKKMDAQDRARYERCRTGELSLARRRDGKPIITDGPFVETKETVGGFDIIECASLDEPSRSHPGTRSVIRTYRL
jgi:hypothetical protein